MKVCIVTPILFPEPGGPSTFVENFCKTLKKDKHQMTVIAISERDGMVTGEAYSVIKIRRQGFKLYRVLKTIITIIKYGKKSEMIFSCGLFLESALAKIITKKPLILRIGGDPVWEKWTGKEGMNSDLKEFQTSRYSLKIELLKHLQRLSCRMADKVVANSYFFKYVMNNWGIKEENIDVVYNGVNKEELNLPTKEELKEKFYFKGRRVILGIGRLIEFKRTNEIIMAFSDMNDNDSNLLIIGDGPKKRELMALSEKLNLSERVSFLGIKSHHEVLEYLKAADIFVLNSVDEVMPNIVLESLAVGTPVIAPEGGGIPEIIQNKVHGLLYPLKKNNQQELKEAMGELFRDGDLRNRLSQNGLLKVGQFDWETSYQKMISIMNLNQPSKIP